MKTPYTSQEQIIIGFFCTYITKTKDQRSEVACYINDQPYSWNVVFLELMNKTYLSQQMILKIYDD